MRSLNRVILIGITVFIMVVFQSCKKKTSIPMLTTNTVTGITQTSAVSGGSITDDGNDDITVKGVCWGSTQNPTAGSNSTDDGTGMSAFTSIINGLTANNTYYVRAYATNSQGTGYGNEVSFSTSPIALASLMTYEVSLITSSSGRTGWKILDDGGGINKVGVCWSISPNPTLTDSHIETDASDNRTYDFSYLLISYLDPKMTYYIKAYAINSAGISYGNQVSFTTSDDRIIFNTD